MPKRMTMTWAAFESAISGATDAREALDALATSSMDDIQAMLDSVGVGDAGRLLAKALTADAPERQTTLAASLRIIDDHLPAKSETRHGLLGRRIAKPDRIFLDGDTIRSILLASLIDSELGGDPEDLRSRAASAAMQWETAVNAELKGLPRKEYNAQAKAGRRVLQKVMQLLLADMQSRPTSSASGT